MVLGRCNERKGLAQRANMKALTHAVFLLSPANLGGQRGRMLFNPSAKFLLAQSLRSGEGAVLAEVFSFVSGLYFRGKATYAQAFARPPRDLAGGFVISPSEGLISLTERVTVERLRRWAETSIDANNPAFTAPLLQDAAALERAYGATTQFVLLGSVATDKYVVPLTRVFGDHLYFPAEFLGRGDMSRGSLLLRSARAGQELAYIPVEGAARRGPRAAARATS